jgi:hypothetical protein
VNSDHENNKTVAEAIGTLNTPMAAGNTGNWGLTAVSN